MQAIQDVGVLTNKSAVPYKVELPALRIGQLPTFAQRLRERRDERGLSQRAISALLRINQSQYSGYEKGKVPGPELLGKMSELLECSIDYLLGETDSPGVIREFENLPEDEKNLVLIYRAYKRGKRIPRAAIRLLRDLDLIDENSGLLIEGPKESGVPGQQEASDRKVI